MEPMTPTGTYLPDREAKLREWRKNRTPIQIWEECERADLLLVWAARELSLPKVVAAVCLCARRTLPHVPAGEARPLAAIVAAEKWGVEPTLANRAATHAAAWAVSKVTGVGAAFCAARAAEKAAWVVAGSPLWGFPTTEIPEANYKEHAMHTAGFVIDWVLSAATTPPEKWKRKLEVEKHEHLKMCKSIRACLDLKAHG